MKCRNCGAEIADGIKECPYCAAQQEGAVQMPQGTARPASISTNALAGKKYEFASSYGANMRGIINSRIYSTVEVAEDRLWIKITPKRLNTVPAVIFEDITAIDISVKISLYYWICIIVSVIAAIPTQGATLLLAAFFVFVGRDRKITISQRNGKDVVMYSSGKKAAEAFKEDMKALTTIR